MPFSQLLEPTEYKPMADRSRAITRPEEHNWTNPSCDTCNWNVGQGGCKSIDNNHRKARDCYYYYPPLTEDLRMRSTNAVLDMMDYVKGEQ